MSKTICRSPVHCHSRTPLHTAHSRPCRTKGHTKLSPKATAACVAVGVLAGAAAGLMSASSKPKRHCHSLPERIVTPVCVQGSAPLCTNLSRSYSHPSPLTFSAPPRPISFETESPILSEKAQPSIIHELVYFVPIATGILSIISSLAILILGVILLNPIILGVGGGLFALGGISWAIGILINNNIERI